MILKIITQIQINSTAEHVWAILTDVDQYPDWNPFIRKVRGTLTPGAPVTLSMSVPLRMVIPLNARMHRFEPEKEFSWTSRFGMPGIFSVEHFFKIRPFGNPGVRFIHGEIFYGVFGFLIGSILNAKFQYLYQNMNAALKTRAEKGVPLYAG